MNDMYKKGLLTRFMLGTPYQAVKFVQEGGHEDVDGLTEGIALLAQVPGTARLTKGEPGLFLDLAKAKKPYGHTAYQRRDPRTGKIVFVKPKGVKVVTPAPVQEEPALVVAAPVPGKKEQVRWSKHLGKPIPLTLLPGKVSGEDADFYNRCKKNGINKLSSFAAELRMYLSDDVEFSDKEFAEACTSVLRDWQRKGILKIASPAEAEKPAPKKSDKAPLWKTLRNPGIDLPPAYKHRKVMKNPVAEEMGFGVVRHLLSVNKPDEIFLSNFAASLAEHAGVKVEPKLPAMLKLFEPVVKAYEADLKKPVVKPKKVAEKTPATHPYEFAIKDGQPDKIRVISSKLLAGHIFTGSKNEDAGMDAKNKFRGTWVPAVKPEDVTLNGSAFPPGWKGKTTMAPGSEYYASIRVPKYVKKEGIIYVRPEHLRGKSGEKWDKVASFSSVYSQVMESAKHDLNSADPRVREIALAIICLDTFHPRIDSDSDKERKEKDRFGLTSLRVKHLWTEKPSRKTLEKDKDAVAEIHFDFIAKGFDVCKSKEMGPGIVRKPFARAADILNGLTARKKPDDQVFSISDSDINEYVQRFNPDAHAHHFRHFHATRIFIKNLQSMQSEIERVRRGKDWSRKKASAAFNSLLKVSGLALGHRIREGKKGSVTGTGTVRNNYIHPGALVQAMKLLGFDLRTGAEKKETAFDEIGALVKAMLDKLDMPPVYQERWLDTCDAPYTDETIRVMTGYYDALPAGVDPSLVVNA